MPNFSQIGGETAEIRLAEMKKKKLDCRNLRWLHKSSPTPVSHPPVSWQPQRPQSLTMERTDRDCRQIWTCCEMVVYQNFQTYLSNYFWIYLWNSRIMYTDYSRLTGLLSFFAIVPVCRTMSDRICDLCTDRDYRKKVQIRSVAVHRLGRISKKVNKLVNLRYLGYIIAKLQKNIPSSCWDPFTSCNVPTYNVA